MRDILSQKITKLKPSSEVMLTTTTVSRQFRAVDDNLSLGSLLPRGNESRPEQR